jgi:hypothetical protein
MIVQCCPLLEELKVIGRACTNAFVMELSKHCRRLKGVSLMDRCVKEESLTALIHSNPGLVSFHTSAHGATENFLQNLTLTCNRLSSLSLSYIAVSQVALFFLLKHCDNLSLVNIEHCQLQTMEAASNFAVVSASIRSLTLNSADIMLHELDRLLRACPGLTSLNLTDCQEWLDLEYLPLGTYCPSLETLTIQGSTSATGDEVLLDIAEHCACLRVLKVPGRHIRSDEILMTLAQQCPLLEELDVSHSSGVTDAALCALVPFARSLKVLNLSGCTQITDEGVEWVMLGCPKLLKLDLRACPRLSQRAKEAAGLRFPVRP